MLGRRSVEEHRTNPEFDAGLAPSAIGKAACLAPSPLWGEGWGEGPVGHQGFLDSPTLTPTLSREREREKGVRVQSMKSSYCFDV